MPFSLYTLPVEIVYRILDHLDNKSLFLSFRNVCTRLNNIIGTYHPYRVILTFIFKSHFHLRLNAFFFFSVVQVRSFSLVLHEFGYWRCTGGIISRTNSSTTCHNEIRRDLFHRWTEPKDRRDYDFLSR